MLIRRRCREPHGIRRADRLWILLSLFEPDGLETKGRMQFSGTALPLPLRGMLSRLTLMTNVRTGQPSRYSAAIWRAACALALHFQAGRAARWQGAKAPCG